MRKALLNIILIAFLIIYIAAGSLIILPKKTTDPVSVDVSDPVIHLDKGSYTVHIDYHSTNKDNETTCLVVSDSDPDAIYSSKVRLEPYYTGFDFDLEVLSPVDDAEFVIINNGGEEEINGITISRNNNVQLRAFIISWFVLIIISVIIMFRSWIRSNIKGIAVCLAAAAVVSLPLLVPALSHGHDFNFHAMRIESIAYELLNGQFPVRMSSLWIAGYGYPASIFYGDATLYLPAVLRIFGFSVNNALKLYILAVNIATATAAYACFSRIFKRFDVTVVTTILYCSSNFRFVDCFVRNTIGEITALIFLPLVALAMYRIYTDDIKSSRYYIDSLILAAGMSGLILTHIITTELTCAVLVIIVLFFIKKTFRKETLMCFIFAVFETLLFTASFTVPFFHYYLQIDTYVRARIANGFYGGIQKIGVSISDLFRFWGSWFGKGDLLTDRMSLTPGIMLMAALLASFVILIMRKGNYRILVLSAASVITLFLASSYFPWDLVNTLPLGNSICSIQFPWRFLGMSMILLTLLAGELLSLIPGSNKKAMIAIAATVAVTAVIISSVFLYYYKKEAVFTDYVDTHSLNIDSVAGSEYIMVGTNQDTLSFEPVIDSGEVEITERRGTTVKVRTVTDKAATVSIPVFAYPNYKTSTEVPVTHGENDMVTFEVSAGDNITTISYDAPFFYRIAEAVSILSVIGAVIICRRTKDISQQK